MREPGTCLRGALQVFSALEILELGYASDEEAEEWRYVCLVTKLS